ncbi:hypothetical protein MCEJIRE27_01195 [Candidatus Nanopelagicaceae bacterium]
MKKLIAVLMGGVVLLGPLSSVSSAAGVPDEQWTPSAFPVGDGWRSLFVSDNSTLNREPSTIYATTKQDGDIQLPSFHCTSVDSPKCVELTSIQASAFLQPCSPIVETNCIEAFYAIDANGNRIDAQSPYEYPATATWNYPGNTNLNLPTGGSPTIWNLPGVEGGSGTTQYMVQAFSVSNLEKSAATKVTNEQFTMNRLTVNIVPVKIISGRYQKQVAQDSTEASAGVTRGVMHPSVDEWRYCAMIGDGSCAQRQAFPSNYNFGVRVRLHKKLSGWLHGRIYNPNVNITSNPAGEQIIEVSASPINVPVIGEWFRWDELTAAIKEYILAGKVRGGQGNHTTKALASGNFQEIIETSGDEALTALGLWLPQIKDKASASPSTWTFSNLPDWQMKNSNNCIRDAKDLVGFVTTNAAVYSAGPPSYNQDLQSLDYKVMAPHLTSNGEVFTGTYDLRIRSEVARCIYGFSSAPIQASLTILSEDGTSQTATQTIDERDGWLSLSAKGFTYSSPTIQVKLSQPQPVVLPEPEMTTQASPQLPAKKVTITCAKGKMKKKVTATKPICPKGYKKIA